MEYLPEGSLIDSEKNREIISSVSGLMQAASDGTVLESRVTMCDAEHNLFVELPCGMGKIPRSEGAMGIDDGTVRDIALISRVNKPVAFTVEEKTENKGKPLFILSRKKAQEQCVKNYISALKPGDVIDAKITHLEGFGAFCDVGCGIASLIPIDCISVSRIFHPSDRFCIGEYIKAVVKEVEKVGNSIRLHLSHKELLGTWEENAALIHSGETVSGIVRTVENYGSFVEIFPNLAGLAEPKEGVYEGQRAAVYVKSIIPEKMKVKLIIINSFEDDEYPCEKNYFITNGNIKNWRYSPDCCPRYIGTEFG